MDCALLNCMFRILFIFDLHLYLFLLSHNIKLECFAIAYEYNLSPSLNEEVKDVLYEIDSNVL